MSVAALSHREYRVLADVLPRGLVTDATLVLGAAGVTGLCAQVSVVTPLSPVPLTLQTLSVLLAGTLLGPSRGLISMLLYVLAGVAGVPWFAGHESGWGGPSFGYLLGFVAASGAVGLLAQRRRDRDVVSSFGAMLFGLLVVYAFGIVWLGVDLHLDVAKAISLGATPFLVTDFAKLLVGSLIAPAGWKWVIRSRRHS